MLPYMFKCKLKLHACLEKGIYPLCILVSFLLNFLSISLFQFHSSLKIYIHQSDIYMNVHTYNQENIYLYRILLYE